jgi:hypothetical protein
VNHSAVVELESEETGRRGTASQQSVVVGTDVSRQPRALLAMKHSNMDQGLDECICRAVVMDYSDAPMVTVEDVGIDVCRLAGLGCVAVWMAMVNCCVIAKAVVRHHRLNLNCLQRCRGSWYRSPLRKACDEWKVE